MIVYKMTFLKRGLSNLIENGYIPIDLLGKVLWFYRKL